MIEELSSALQLEQAKTKQHYLCIHGHFYQPPREDPFTDILPLEVGAAPFSNYNEKITSECYQPNADAGNFDAISFDMGPTLATWLEQKYPFVYRRILEADQKHVQRYGVGNAMAQAYNHTILPLATSRDKRTQIKWGLLDFHQRFGRDAHGMWLAETGVDLECLDIMAEYGVTYTILAPWQAMDPVDTNEPYLVRLPSGRTITVFFYNGPLSGGVSFDASMTNDANRFASYHLQNHIKENKDDPQLLMVATDGELYGHHQSWRDKFLAHLLHHSAPEFGFEVCTPERYMQLHPPTREVIIRAPSAWSCAHGVARWSLGCGCTEGISSWKHALRQALNNLSAHGDQLFEEYGSEILHDPWAARDEYLCLRNGWETADDFWARHCKNPLDKQHIQRARVLLEAQYYFQYSFTSCGFFFEDLDRIEPRNDIAFARRAISYIWQEFQIDLQENFVRDLQAAHSWRTSRTGADLYKSLPAVPFNALPYLKI